MYPVCDVPELIYYTIIHKLSLFLIFINIYNIYYIGIILNDVTLNSWLYIINKSLDINFLTNNKFNIKLTGEIISLIYINKYR